jgi:hypothetical protein
MKPLAQSMMLPLRFSRYAMFSERASTIFKYTIIALYTGLQCLDRVNKGETMGGMNLLIVRLWPVVLHSTASHVAAIIPIRPMRCISIVMWKIRDGGSGRYETEGQCRQPGRQS